ncbi:MAG: hypothetical protein GQ582_07945 [Methyloprofundus sp.]|nr:hypothetical protein [Methyloprofundus sp.]
MNVFSNIFVSSILTALCFFSISAHSDANKLAIKMENEQSEKITKKREWLGVTFQQAENELGSLSNEEVFNMRDTLITEFRGKLELLFPKSIIKNDLIWIKEVSWNLKNCVLTIWFQKQKENWIAVDSLYWEKGSEF